MPGGFLPKYRAGCTGNSRRDNGGETSARH
jgi:hypothetical protein